MGGKKKKGGGGKGKKGGAVDDETKEEMKRIMMEIYNAPSIEDYPTNLEQAQKLVETENIEFYVLVQRLQNINFRLEQDTIFLKEEQVKKDAEIKVET